MTAYPALDAASSAVMPSALPAAHTRQPRPTPAAPAMAGPGPDTAAVRTTYMVSRPGVTVISAANAANARTEASMYYSTVTDFARLRGWSTSWPRAAASVAENTWSGTV